MSSIKPSLVNLDRFPDDFMFRLSKEEFDDLKSQFVTLHRPRSTPRVFSEQGVAMLSSVLRSKRAVQVNIEIMRTLVRLREILSTHRKLNALEKKYDAQFRAVFDGIRQLLTPPKLQQRQQAAFATTDNYGFAIRLRRHSAPCESSCEMSVMGPAFAQYSGTTPRKGGTRCLGPCRGSL